jgi:hypothetical protein
MYSKTFINYTEDIVPFLWITYDTHAPNGSQTTCCSNRPKTEITPHTGVSNPKTIIFTITLNSKQLLLPKFEVKERE